MADWSPLDGLSLTALGRDAFCELPPLPIETRLKNRTFPSVFSAWDGIRVQNLPQLSNTERLALHDLHWHEPYFRLDFNITPNGWRLGGRPNEAQPLRDELLALNPNMIFIAEVRVRDEYPDRKPEDWPHWLRDADGNRVATPSGSKFLIDFTQPGTQDMIVQQAVAVAKCGLFDGLFFDWFAEHFRFFRDITAMKKNSKQKTSSSSEYVPQSVMIS